jgi:hypothetical protein
MIIFPLFYLGGKFGPLTLREEQRVFQKRVRRMFGTNREEVTGSGTKWRMRRFLFRALFLVLFV